MHGETLVEAAYAWTKSYVRPYCSSRTEEVRCPVAGGGDMNSDRKAGRVSRDGAYGREGECQFAMAVLASVVRCQ